jgi:predicted Zn-dependent protease
MKFTPKSPDHKVNVSQTHPLAELFWLLGGLVLVAGIVFLALGLATDLAVSKTPLRVENWLGNQALKQFPATPHPALQCHLNNLLTTLPPDSPLRAYTFQVFLSENNEINAIALPGGNIVVYSGLLRQVESENELAMVLYHELGHFAHRDHLRGLGRGLGLTVASALLFGRDSAASEVVSKTLLSFQVNYSQHQESAADRFGLEMLTRHYGHAGGSTDFFSRLASTSKGKLPYLLASHPHPENRIEKLNDLINENRYIIGITLPLAEDLQLKI